MELTKGTAAAMCNGSPNVLPYGLRVPNPTPLLPVIGGMNQQTLDFHRAQVYDYSSRLNLQFALRGYPTLAPYHHMGNANDPFRHLYLYAKHDPRANFIHEEPKPSQSYIGLIAMAILSIPEKKMVLSDIYQYILDHYAYFRTRGPGWRNSIRHNLSLNDCFIKSGRSANGKGHYWAIHPANMEDFKKGDFRRRRAQRRVRKYLGLSVPDDEDSPSPPPPNPTQESWNDEKPIDGNYTGEVQVTESAPEVDNTTLVPTTILTAPPIIDSSNGRCPGAVVQNDRDRELVKKPTGIKRRLFDMESLLAPDNDSPRAFKTFVASDLSIRRGGREGRDDSDTEINVADDSGSHEDKSSLQFSPDSGHGTLDQSSISKGESEDGNVEEDQEALDLQIHRSRQTSEEREGAAASVTKLHLTAPTVITNGLGMTFPTHHVLPTQGALCWPERTSAFQRMMSVPVPTSLAPTSYSSLLVQARPSFPICVTQQDSISSAQKWQETLSRIMARSYDKVTKNDS